MSTKSSLKYGECFHLYNEIFDDDFVYLEMRTRDVELSLADGVAYVTVRIPNDIATQLGLTPQKDASDGSNAE